MINLPEYDVGFSGSGYNERLVPDASGSLLKRARMDLIHADHPDDTAAGKFVVTAVSEQPATRCLYRAVYMGYAIQNLPDVMTPFEKYNQEVAGDAGGGGTCAF